VVIPGRCAVGTGPIVQRDSRRVDVLLGAFGNTGGLDHEDGARVAHVSRATGKTDARLSPIWNEPPSKVGN